MGLQIPIEISIFCSGLVEGDRHCTKPLFFSKESYETNGYYVWLYKFQPLKYRRVIGEMIDLNKIRGNWCINSYGVYDVKLDSIYSIHPFYLF